MKTQPSSSPRCWHILGAGAVGSLFGWHLLDSGHPVRFLFHNHAEAARIVALHRNGVPQPACLFEAALPGERIDRLLICVKAHHTAAAFAAIEPQVAHGAQVLLLQNGMGAWEPLQTQRPDIHWLLGTTTEGVHRPADGRIIHAGRGETWLGSLVDKDFSLASAWVRNWRDQRLLLRADPNILVHLWRKLAINCVINPLTVLEDCPNGELLQRDRTREQMAALCTEVRQVLRARAPQLDTPQLLPDIQRVAQLTGANISSMLQDYRRGRETEIEFITGFLVRQARELELSVPENEAVLAEVRQLTAA